MFSEIETEGTNFPTCPSCGQKDEDWWDGIGQKNDNDTWNSSCGSCGADYEVKMWLSCSFHTKLDVSND